MNKFDNFLEKLPAITNEKDLCDLICTLGLFKDNRPIYGQYTHYQVEQGGAWQDPMELATFLWSSRDDFRGINSYLEIGTFTGYTFFIILNFLKTFVNPFIRAKTVDPNIFIDPEIMPYIQPYFQRGTSEDVKDEQYDLVFIDGCHEAPWPQIDLDNVKDKSNIIFFHDIVDVHCPFVKETFQNIAFINKHKIYTLACKPDLFGIGIIFMNR